MNTSRTIFKALSACLLPSLALAQAAAGAPASTWGGGLGFGNGLELHGDYQTAGHLLLLGRARYKWWGPSSGPGVGQVEHSNTSSRQTEIAALAVYGLPVGRSLLYGAAGVAYVAGRQLGEYRYSTLSNGLASSDATYYYAYRSYQALGLPVEIGFRAPPLRGLRLGLAGQANFNPEHSVYCVLLTLWADRLGGPLHRAR